MPELIGLSGYARTGKDTVASILAGAGYVRVAFADALRDALLATDPMVYADRAHNPVRLSAVVAECGWEHAKSRQEVRRLLQAFGHGMRGVQPGVWVQIGMRKASDLIAAGHRVVITDVRYPDEAAAIRAGNQLRGVNPGQVWRVNRDGYGPVNGHASETALDGHGFDRQVWNNGTLAELRQQVLRMVS